MTVTISCANLDEFRARLTLLASSLPAVLTTANDEIERLMRDTLAQLYTPRLEKYWQVEKTASDTGAVVRVYTDSLYVYGYEYGHRVDTIYPVNKQALAFTVNGQKLVRKWARAFKGYHKSEAVAIALGAIARQAWNDAILAALEQE